MPGKRTPEQQAEHMRAYRQGVRDKKWQELQAAGGAEVISKPPKPKEPPPSVAGLCDCGAGRPHNHYFDGWFAQMSIPEAKGVYDALAANHHPERSRR